MHSFSDCKLPTLSFRLYLGEDGIEHTYFEKEMKNQVLLMKRSALGNQQIISIMTNELRRRLEVLGEGMPQHERNYVVNKYTKQLLNSGLNWKQCRNILVSAITGQTR